MNSVPKFTKKALSSVVVSATILWSMGAATLVGSLTANAAAMDGDLITAKGIQGAVYYYKGGARYTFPNEKTYKTWFKDFKNVKTITLSELQSYPLKSGGNGNVEYRAGTRLVKITTDPKVYAVTPGGVLRWVKDEATAKALYGANWAKMVDDVPDAFFTNYSVGADLGTATYPDGSLLSMGGNYYYIQDGKKRMVSSDALTGNGFNTAYAIAASDLSAYTDGTALGTAEVADVSQGASSSSTPSPSTTPTAAGSLTIATAGDTTASGSVVANSAASNGGGQRFAKVLKFTAMASGGDAMVTQLVAKRLGISKDGDIDQLYIADANGKILAKSNSISSGMVTFLSGAGLFTVPAGQTVSFWLEEDVNKSAPSASTQGWSIDASNVKLSGTGTVTGSATSNMFTVATVTDLGQLEFASSSPISGSPTADAGRTNYTMGTFKFAAINQDVLVKKVTFTQIGTVNIGDLQNLKASVAGTQFDSVKAQVDAGNKITFDFTLDLNGKPNADGGLKILAGQTKFVDLIGDIVGGTNRTYQWSIQNQEEVSAFDNNYKVYVPADDWNTDAFATESTVATTINTLSLTIGLATDSPNTNVTSGGTGVLLAKYTLTASGENAKFSALTVEFTRGSGSAIRALKNVKLLLDGVQVGSTVTSSTPDTGTDVSTLDSAFTFSNNFIVQVGKPSTLQVVADTNDSTATAGDTVYAKLVAGSNNMQGVTSLKLSSSTAVSGYTVTLQSGTPSIVLNNSIANATTAQPTGVLNDTNAELGSFVVQAGAGEGSEITSIQLADNTVALNGLFTNMRLQHNGADIAPAIGTLSASGSTYSYNLSTAVDLNKGDNYVVDVVANVLSTTSSSAINTAAATLTVAKNGVTYRTLSTGQSGTAPSSAALTLQQNYLVQAGTLTVAQSSDTPVAQTYVMGALAQPLFKFKLTAGAAEDVNVSQIVSTAAISVSAVSPTSILRNLTLLDDSGKQVGSIVASLNTTNVSDGVGITKSIANVTFSSLGITVPKNTSKNYTVVSDISPTPNTLSGETVQMYLLNSYDKSASTAFTANGAKSGTSISSVSGDTILLSTTISGNTLSVYKTKPSIAFAATSPSGATSKSIDQPVAKFVVSNTANVNTQAATIELMTPSIATSISQAAATARKVKIFKTELTSSGNQLASTTIDSTSNAIGCNLGGSRTDATCPAFSTSTARDSDFTDTVIESGASQTFTVTVDTSDAAANNTLSVGVSSQGILWGDGYTNYITTFDTLPLTGKTLTY